MSIFKKEISDELKKLLELEEIINNLLMCDKYVAKSEYLNIKEYNNIIGHFNILNNNNVLKLYCIKNRIKYKKVLNTIDKYTNIEKLIDKKNEEYINKELINNKEYLDNIFDDILLDDDQRRVILTDEDYCLVVAGAGAGKTTTVAAKVKYLVEKQDINPEEILIVTFTNKAVGELRTKINKDMKINAPISTFHSVGNAILKKQSSEKLNIVEDSKLYYLVLEYFKSTILKNESTVNSLILFFASYFDAPDSIKDLNEFFNKIAKSNYVTLKSDLNEFEKEIYDRQKKQMKTIQNEILRSKQEVEIANFLYINGIDYEYEPIYKYNILYSNKPYTPDFIIKQGNNICYLEHFGISEDGKNDRYTKQELTRYKQAIKDKISLHKKHKTNLIYTFSKYKNGTLINHLEEELIKNGFELNRRSDKEILEKLISQEENKYIRKIVNLVCRFITNFKTNGYTLETFNQMYHSTNNVRNKLFLNICEDCYLEYERYLKENNSIDFQDMINESAKILKETKQLNKKLNFKYIIVDEYQDISKQRFDLVKALHEVTSAKIMAVGDDWQSIYAFSGSDINLFTKFKDIMGYAKLLKIVKTYRNSQEVIDIAGNFVQKNKQQITKKLISPKHITNPVVIYTYDSTLKRDKRDLKSGVNYAQASKIEEILDFIVNEDKESKSILLLGRFGFDGDRLSKSGLFTYNPYGSKMKSIKYPNLDITFMTVHASKGLGYDNVIVINGKNETYGFPSKIEDDPVLNFVVKQDRNIDYAEERRLFYVALTRTKNRVFFIAPSQNPSEFLLEIKKDYKNVLLKGNWNNSFIPYERKSCPICGYPMQFRYKSAYGLPLFICTNEPEICGFMTNKITKTNLSICKCLNCKDGYLIVKSTKNNGYFLGCTNYKPDGSGCNNTL